MTDDQLTDKEENHMIAKLKNAGKYSTKYKKNDKWNACDRCVNAKTPTAVTSATSKIKNVLCADKQGTGVGQSDVKRKPSKK